MIFFFFFFFLFARDALKMAIQNLTRALQVSDPIRTHVRHSALFFTRLIQVVRHPWVPEPVQDSATQLSTTNAKPDLTVVQNKKQISVIEWPVYHSLLVT